MYDQKTQLISLVASWKLRHAELSQISVHGPIIGARRRLADPCTRPHICNHTDSSLDSRGATCSACSAHGWRVICTHTVSNWAACLARRLSPAIGPALSSHRPRSTGSFHHRLQAGSDTSCPPPPHIDDRPSQVLSPRSLDGQDAARYFGPVGVRHGRAS